MTDVLEHLYVELDKKITLLQNEVSNGRATDYAEYKYICGKIRGLVEAGDIIKDLETKMESDEENHDE